MFKSIFIQHIINDFGKGFPMNSNHYEKKVFFHSSERMIEIGDQEIDLILTSPPYWGVSIWKRFECLRKFMKDKISFFSMLRNVFAECYRILKFNGKMSIIVGPSFRSFENPRGVVDVRFDDLCAIDNLCRELGFRMLTFWIWHKGHLRKYDDDRKKKFQRVSNYRKEDNDFQANPNVEFLLIYYKPSRNMAKSGKSEVSINEWKVWKDQVWRIPTVPINDVHCAMNPFEIYRRIAKIYSNKGSKVLDPFCGSGTIFGLKDRHLYGYEINTEFQKVINERMRLNLF